MTQYLTENRSFYIAMLILIGVSVSVLVLSNMNIEQRENNFKLIENSKNCEQLSINFENSMEFEKGFYENGKSEEVMELHERMMNELGCKVS